ncbi:MAG: 2-oxoacid:ferredoxin oxidoreductase subunit beta, partial [Candidatus Aegiribacteria sp.]
LLLKAFRKTGFSVVEVLAPCPTNFGRANRQGGPVEMMKLLKDNTINTSQLKAMKEGQAEGKVVRGIFVDRDDVSYGERYQTLCENARKAAEAEK